MTFFFDNNLPRRAVEILKLVEYEVVHFQEIYPHQQYPVGVPDEVWIPEVGGRGWIIVAGDQRILTRPAEWVAPKKAHVVAYFVYRGFPQQKILQQARWLIKHWDNVEQHAKGAALSLRR